MRDTGGSGTLIVTRVREESCLFSQTLRRVILLGSKGRGLGTYGQRVVSEGNPLQPVIQSFIAHSVSLMRMSRRVVYTVGRVGLRVLTLGGPGVSAAASRDIGRATHGSSNATYVL